MSSKKWSPRLNKNQHKATPFWRHLEELRNRLVRVAILFVILVFVAFWQADPILKFLLEPVQNLLPKNSHFIATDATTGWIVSFKVSLFAAFYIIFPYAFFEIWRFLSPGLEKNEKRGIVPLAILMSSFFIGGGLFAYQLVMPLTLQFLIGIYEGTFITYLPDIDVTLSFVMRLVFGFGLLFETPFFLLALGISGLVTRQQMSKARPTMIVIAFVVAAILTPPDVASQTMMAVPFLFLYEFGIILVWLTEKIRR